MSRNSTIITLEPVESRASAVAPLPAMKGDRAATIHPLWLRATHWLNAIAVVLMVTSGWRIYNASPVYAMRFPGEMTLGGWLGGALQWHFAGMWLLAVGADPNLSHRADRILSQGWKPTLIGSAVDKFRS
jgi:thiosulfate reductase cytochrome b subunit